VLHLAQEAPIPDLNALVVFAKVVEANSFSEAARRLQMPISTVSRRIAELEDELGVRLLDRSTRNLRLTELGPRYWSRPSAAPS
jgi:DNA-binding transcriptional LysR family regulator